MMKRKSAVAGHFYSSSGSGLSSEVQKYIKPSTAKERAIGIISPHAGLMYSGAVAGAVYSRIKFPRTFILLGPNHTGLGKPISIMSSGEWEIPTGSLKIDELLAKKIKDNSEIFEEDSFAHSMEHSLEVQIPFIIHFSSDVRIVPVTIMQNSLDVCRLAADAIATAIKKTDYPVTIIASSDMNHFESDTVTRVKDRKAIDKILALDPEGLYETVVNEEISMCGYIPATIMLFAANILGAKEADLVKYMTSGEVNNDYERVVGYAGVIIK
ncbi:MAG: AmmeMemoRadiSam system protein B [Nitrospirae bacterium]|nr:AmmeMemoRadiSam system protein B [Nitrospirota bacterium]